MLNSHVPLNQIMTQSDSRPQLAFRIPFDFSLQFIKLLASLRPKINGQMCMDTDTNTDISVILGHELRIGQVSDTHFSYGQR